MADALECCRELLLEDERLLRPENLRLDLLESALSRREQLLGRLGAFLLNDSHPSPQLALGLEQLLENTNRLYDLSAGLRLELFTESKKAEQELRLLQTLLEGALEGSSSHLIDRLA